MLFKMSCIFAKDNISSHVISISLWYNEMLGLFLILQRAPLKPTLYMLMHTNFFLFHIKKKSVIYFLPNPFY